MSQPNAEQSEYWNSTAGRTWAESSEPLDRQLAPLGRAAMAALRANSGERLLDVGCGAGLTSVRFLQGDAQHFPFAPGTFDAAYSRFGVMFFADPVAAFANLRRALKPGGRLAFACWRPMEESPAFTVPLQAAVPHLPPLPPARDPDAPGPFAFASQERVRRILAAAGFDAIRVAPHDEAVGVGDLETAVALALRMGPLGRLLVDHPSLREGVAPPVRAAMAAYAGPDGVRLDAAIWIVTARSAT